MSRLSLLKTMCQTYSFDRSNEFSNLLKCASNIFPGIDLELSRLFDFSIDTVALWRDGTLVPDKMTQKDLVRFIYSKALDHTDKPEENVSTDMIVYDSHKPANYIPTKVYFFQPALSYGRLFVNGLKSFFYSGDVSLNKLDKLIVEAQRDREAIFHAKLTRRISKCNRAILKAIRTNRPSVAFSMGNKTIENVRLSNAVCDYLRSAGFDKVGIAFEYSFAREGNVFVEINLQ